jgi:hypothetical protein
MKRSLLVVGVAAALMVAWSIGRVQGQQGEGKVVFASPDQATFTTTNPGVSMAAIWGDATTGAHGTFTKFAPGYDAGMHTHTNDVWIVGVKGAYLYKDDAGEKAWAQAISYASPADTSIGAAATRKKARCSTKNRPVNLI